MIERLVLPIVLHGEGGSGGYGGYGGYGDEIVTFGMLGALVLGLVALSLRGMRRGRKKRRTRPRTRAR